MRGGRSNCKEGRDRSQESIVEKILPSLGRGTNTEFDIPLEALTNEVSKTVELDKESSCDKRQVRQDRGNLTLTQKYFLSFENLKVDADDSELDKVYSKYLGTDREVAGEILEKKSRNVGLAMENFRYVEQL